VRVTDHGLRVIVYVEADHCDRGFRIDCLATCVDGLVVCGSWPLRRGLPKKVCMSINAWQIRNARSESMSSAQRRSRFVRGEIS